VNGSGLDESISVEVEGENSVPVLMAMAEIASDNTELVERIQVSIESQEPLTMDEYLEDMYKTGPKSKDVDVNFISFSCDSDAFKLAQCMTREEAGWKNTEEIKRKCENKSLIPLSKVSQVLWDLAERGILKKRPCDSDRRMKEYHITELGERSVEKIEE
jgi:hypothetical protein